MPEVVLKKGKKKDLPVGDKSYTMDSRIETPNF